MEGARDERAAMGWGMRLGLLLLAASALPVGLWASFAPRSFYEDFPAPGRYWVSTIGPYNEHLVTDVGAGYLALGTLLGLAGILFGRTLVRVSVVAWLAYAVPHFAFHLTTLDAFSLADNLASMGSLGLAVLIPLLLLAGTYRTPQKDESEDRGTKERRIGA
ncbi:hypothetical protein BH24ACT19_BH24ACT19_11950 [soil metagenome]